MEKIVVDWHKMYLHDPYALPGSQGKAILLLQSFYVPLQAFLSLTSGKYAADLSALNHYVNSEEIICEVCGCKLNRGDGHDKENCSIYQRAMHVLSDKSDPRQRMLLHERQRYAAKMSEIDENLDRINSNKAYC